MTFKIKNRYIITMVHKSKKINRRRYLKHLQKIQSRKRMYGGSENDYTPPPPLTPPTIGENLERVGNLAVSAATNVVAHGINSAAENLGIDPNKTASESVAELSNSAGKIADALDSPEGEKLKQEASELLSDSIDIVKPSIEKGEKILTDGLKKVADTGNSIVMTALNEFPPMFALTEVSKFATAAAQAGETVAELTTTGAEAVEDLQSQKKRAESIYSGFKNVVNNITTGVNRGVSNMLKTAQQNVDEYGQNVVKEGIKNVPTSTVPEMPQTILQTGGASLKKYQKEAEMIGGRIHQSQLSFLSPYVNRGRILKQYGGKLKTKRRYKLKHKLTSRSYK